MLAYPPTPPSTPPPTAVARLTALAFPHATVPIVGRWTWADVAKAINAGFAWMIVGLPAIATVLHQLGPMPAGGTALYLWIVTFAYTFSRLVQAGPTPAKG